MSKAKITYRYVAAPGAGYNDDEAQIIGKEFEAMARTGVEIAPDAIVDRAKCEDNPLHKYFTWDNDVAANAYRKHEARQLSNHLQRIEIVGNQERTVKAMFSVQMISRQDETQEDNDQPQYVSVQTVRDDKTLRAQVVAKLWSELQSWKRRAESIDAGEFKEVLAVVDEISPRF